MMISLKKLKDREEISPLLPHYEKTFPADERRENEQFLALTENPDVDIFALLEGETTIGYAVIWNLGTFFYLEHFEVFEEFRNRKFGAAILNLLTHEFSKMVLESEPSDLDEIAARRIGFYERNGFQVIDKNYIQPSYGDGKSSMELYLLANFPIINLPEITDKIHQTVYHFWK